MKTPDFIGSCDCCRREGRQLWVASSGVGAISLAWCLECLEEGAEPEWGLEYLWSDVGDRGQGLHEGIKNLRTFKDGRYWTWPEWDAWRKEQPDADRTH